MQALTMYEDVVSLKPYFLKYSYVRNTDKSSLSCTLWPSPDSFEEAPYLGLALIPITAHV